MRKFIMVVLIALIFVFVFSGILAWTYRGSLSPKADLEAIQQIRDETILYISANHTETSPLLNNLSWSGGNLNHGVLATETYLFISGNWEIKISYPVVTNPIYSVCANYTSQEARVIWKGDCQDGILKEVSSDITLNNSGLMTQPQIRDLAMNYIKIFHNETASYMSSLNWAGGRVTVNGLFGSETYTYLSTGWTVTLKYPVVPNPIYTITVQYVSSGLSLINWQGTLQDGLIIETAYDYTQ